MEGPGPRGRVLRRADPSSVGTRFVLPSLGVLVSWGYLDKFPQTWWLQATEVPPLPVATAVRSQVCETRCGLSRTPPEGSRAERAPVCPPGSVGGCVAAPGLRLHLASVCTWPPSAPGLPAPTSRHLSLLCESLVRPLDEGGFTARPDAPGWPRSEVLNYMCEDPLFKSGHFPQALGWGRVFLGPPVNPLMVE